MKWAASCLCACHGDDLNSWQGLRTYQFYSNEVAYGPTQLIAAMRCYVASKLGHEVNVPEGLE
jgi:hypothetical protein